MYFIASTGEQFIAIFAGFRLLITVVAKENTDAMINTHTDTASTSPGIIVGLRACNTCGITNLPTMAEQINPRGIPITVFHNICLFIILLI